MDNYLSLLVLSCLRKINGERTIYSIFHLLKGKKSSQTIQDAHLFQLTNLFQTFPQLSRTFFYDIILDLEKKGHIQYFEGEKYYITQLGLNCLEETKQKHPIPNALNGWKYHSIQDDFWKRLSLLVQVCSNLINFDSSYIPIHNDLKLSEWLKTTLLKLKKNRSSLANELLQEIIKCLTQDDELKPEVVVWRLTGYKQIGLTSTQTAEFLEMDKAYFQLHFLNTIHFMIGNIMINETDFPILQNLLFDYQKPIVLTNSSLLTYRYLKLGHSIDEIALLRNLKTSTIEDHVVEIALNDENFLLEPFVSTEKINKIREVIKKISTKQLKMIRQELKNQVSYFQIRLVLAKIGDQL